MGLPAPRSRPTSAARAFGHARTVLSGRPIVQSEARLVRVRQVRVPNDFSQLEITVSNNMCGEGVVVSSLGDGLVAKAGVLVGDVIIEVDGEAVQTHEEALGAMRSCGCADILLSLAGKATKIEIDKSEENWRDLEVTLENAPSGAGVVVTMLGEAGLCARSGLREGDVLLSVNGVLVAAHAEAIALIDAAERFVDLAVAEGDDTIDVAI